MTWIKETKASVIARYWYCAEEGKKLFMGVKSPKSPCKKKGSEVHNWLELRPKSKGEQKLIYLLNQLNPFSRDFHSIKIYGCPDDYQVIKKRVTIEEYKTIHGYSSIPWFERFELCCATCQVKTYCWIMEPILKKIGYTLNPKAKIILYSHNGRFLKQYSVLYDVEETEGDLTNILSVYREETPSIMPNPIKCKRCDKIFKEGCRAI